MRVKQSVFIGKPTKPKGCGLEMEHSPGQPTKLTEEERHRLAAMLEQHAPADVGFEARYTSTLPLVAEWRHHERAWN